MRRIYLIRHGLPDFPEGERYCLGSADMPLGVLGRLQACQLGRGLRDVPIDRVFSSPLSRARQTAEYIRGEYTVLPGLEEMSAGDWDGLSFREIIRRWPELFEKRGGGDYVPIPNAETPEHGQRRFLAAVESALSRSAGDVAIVAHTTVNQSLVSYARGESLEANMRLRQDYCSYYELGYDGGFTVLCEARRPRPPLDRPLAGELMAASGLPERTAAHCRAVADRALELCGELAGAGLALDEELVCRAALVHDIARSLPEHDRVGAGWLEELGYRREADLVRQHHGLDRLHVDEAAVLYIADKCVMEDTTVSLSERFENSLARCKTEEARAAHGRRAAEALAVKTMINDYCGKETIK